MRTTIERREERTEEQMCSDVPVVPLPSSSPLLNKGANAEQPGRRTGLMIVS